MKTSATIQRTGVNFVKAHYGKKCFEFYLLDEIPECDIRMIRNTVNDAEGNFEDIKFAMDLVGMNVTQAVSNPPH